MKVSRRQMLVIAGYTVLMAILPIVLSPAVLGVLSFTIMGFRLDTLWQGLATGFLVCFLLGIAELLPFNIRKKMFKDVKTTKEFNNVWKIQMMGGYDGVIAESHWSGAIIPLFLLLFGFFKIVFPVALVLSIVCRWGLHSFAHLLFPSHEEGRKYYGNFSFTVLGLLVEDTVNTIVFVISGSILAPILVHTFQQPVAQFVGVKRKLARELGFEQEIKSSTQ